jgi:predicted nucleic acid-binding protein
MVVVDTSIWIESARREGQIACKVGLEGLLDFAEAMICGPIRMEVLAGARPEDRPKLTACFGSIPCKPFDDAAWDLALFCASRLHDKGHAIPWNDILIGSLSLQWGCRVYADDPHFETMRQIIGVRLYQPGYGGKFTPERPVAS